MKFKFQSIISLVSLALFQFSCGSSGSGLSTSASLNADITIGSPLSTSSSANAVVVKGSREFNATALGSSIAARKAILTGLLAASSADDCNFAVDLNRGIDRASCYGPELALGVAHPDGAIGGNLPTGDLGFWNSTEGSTTEACAAAQLNALVDVHTKKAFFAMALGTAARCFIDNTASLSVPTTVGGTVAFDATQLADFGFTNAESDTVSVSALTVTGIQDSDGNQGLRFEASGSVSDNGATAQDFSIVFQNASKSAGGFNGVASYSVQDTAFTPNNCNNQRPGVGAVFGGHLVYDWNPATSTMIQEFQTAEFCGSDAAPLNSSYQISACDKFDNTSNTDGWADNYNAGVFAFNPTTLVGNYAYFWSAGLDPQTRRLNVTVEEEGESTVGRAYFGYGDPASTGTGEACTAFSDFVIDGMVCNWAGPGGYIGSPYTPEAYTQRQSIAKNATSGLWEVASEQIIYAPTNACTCGGGCSLTYQATGSTDYSNDNDNADVMAATDGLDLESLTDYQADFSAPTRPTF